MIPKIYYHPFILILLFAVFLMPVAAQANLGISPTIVHFDDGERYKDVILINTTEQTKTYEMSWKFMEMQETGASYKAIDKSLSDFDVSKYVFYTPRRVTIPAKGSQRIRLAFRRPAEMPEGDFYAHLLFSPAENPEIDLTKEQARSASAGVGVKVGYSIPVIVRSGAYSESAKIGQIKIRRSATNKLVLDVPVIRPEGNYGVIGHLVAYHLSADGKEEIIGEVVNANVFTEINQRIVPVTLTKEVKSGKIKLVLKSGKKKDETVFDQKVFPIN